MLTRAQVARRLGKSIATVRRLEGVALHPVIDDEGVHRFDETEVERLVDRRRGVAERCGQPPGTGRSSWFDTRMRARTRQGQTDADDDADDHEDLADDDNEACEAASPSDGEARGRREAELARREHEIGQRERTLVERERQVRERETALPLRQEPTAADALRDDPRFRRLIRTRAAQLVDELSRVPTRAVHRIVSEEEVALLEALLSGSD